jgi:NADH:ubiquinone oxidoreductase subunit 3 (subunit A)
MDFDASIILLFAWTLFFQHGLLHGLYSLIIFFSFFCIAHIFGVMNREES